MTTRSVPPDRSLRALEVSRPARAARVAFRAIFALTTALILAVRLWNLDRMPGELYGDIAIVYEYIADIFAGAWPTYFVLSAGPLYHYLITPVVSVLGLTYLGLKVASVLVSLGVLAALYLLARELLDERLALLALFVAGVSSWLLIFSRLGNSQILVPLLSTAAILFALRLVRHGRQHDLIAAAVVSALGLYTYPQSYILPPVIFATLVCLLWTRTQVRPRHLRDFAMVTLVCALPFAAIVAQNPANFVSGYIGGKIRPSGELLPLLLGNARRALLALHLQGDKVFRSNPASLPHLDAISSVLFLGGLVFWLLPERRRWSPLILVPFVLLQLPSMLVLSNPAEVPSASRTLAVAPIAYLLVASGLWWLLDRGLRFRRLASLVALCLLASILYLNTWRYFKLYIAGLPNQNLAHGRMIAEYIDRLPSEAKVYMVGCCWSDRGEPEPKGIRYATKRPAALVLVEEKNATCDFFASAPRPAYVIWSPSLGSPTPAVAACLPLPRSELYFAGDRAPIFRYVMLPAVAPATGVESGAAQAPMGSLAPQDE